MQNETKCEGVQVNIFFIIIAGRKNVTLGFLSVRIFFCFFLAKVKKKNEQIQEIKKNK